MTAVLATLGRVCLAGYFLKAGINNANNFKKLINVLARKNVPLPTFALALVVFVEIVGSLAVIFNIYAAVGAVALAIFTVAANFYFCNYWTMENFERRNVNFLFYANLAVIGGLLLIVAMQT